MNRDSVSVAKGCCRRDKKPHPEGSPLLFYNVLACAPGEAVCTRKTQFGGRRASRLATYLNNFYGTDIRRIKASYWCLVGEWNGSRYIDYVARRQKRHVDRAFETGLHA